MQPGWGEEKAEEGTDLLLCLFPHLPEFLVLDTRKGLPSGPRLLRFTSDQVLAPPFFQQVEQAFQQLLRPRGRALTYLTLLGEQVELLVRQEAMKAIAAAVGDEPPLGPPRRVGLLVCAGGVLRLPAEEVRRVLQSASRGDADAATLGDWLVAFEELRDRERAEVRREELERAREVVNPQGSEFYTLWQNPNR
ncbi:MAG: hypothetical protein HY535_06815 [Chloroflexi bacterium]|nr:hypothetical protein [Chloroflexota bacterium]